MNSYDTFILKQWELLVKFQAASSIINEPEMLAFQNVVMVLLKKWKKVFTGDDEQSLYLKKLELNSKQKQYLFLFRFLFNFFHFQ